MKARLIECYRENGGVSRFALEEYADADTAREEAAEMNACYWMLGVSEHWVEVVLR